MPWKKLAYCVLLATLVASGGDQDPAPAHITIVVTDPSGARIPRAQVRLTQAPASDLRMETDDKGELDFDLKPGSYELSVNRQGFKEFTAHLDAQATKWQTLPAVLQVAQTTGGGSIKPAPTTLELRFPFRSPVRLRAADLQVRPHTSVTVHNPHTNADDTYSGVRLAELLADYGAPLGDQLRGKSLLAYVVAAGSDGYKVVFALAEIDPTFHPGEVIVADTMNGKALDEKTGPFRLVMTEDKRPARSVRNLVSIELKMAD